MYDSGRVCAFPLNAVAPQPASSVMHAVLDAHRQHYGPTSLLESMPLLCRGYHFVLMLFMASAMPLESQQVRGLNDDMCAADSFVFSYPQGLFTSAADCLRPGGYLLFRDYGPNIMGVYEFAFILSSCRRL